MSQKRGRKFSNRRLKDNLIKFEIFFEDLSFQQLEEFQAYPAGSFLHSQNSVKPVCARHFVYEDRSLLDSISPNEDTFFPVYSLFLLKFLSPSFPYKRLVIKFNCDRISIIDSMAFGSNSIGSIIKSTDQINLY